MIQTKAYQPIQHHHDLSPFEGCHFEQFDELGRTNILGTPIHKESPLEFDSQPSPLIITFTKGFLHPHFDHDAQLWRMGIYQLNNNLEIISSIDYPSNDNRNKIMLVFTTFNALENCFHLQFAHLTLDSLKGTVRIDQSIPLDRPPLKLNFKRIHLNKNSYQIWIFASFSKGSNLILYQDAKSKEWNEWAQRAPLPFDEFWDRLPNRLLVIQPYNDEDGNRGWITGSEDGVITSLIRSKHEEEVKHYQWELASPITSIQLLNNGCDTRGILVSNSMGQMAHFRDFTVTSPQNLTIPKSLPYDPILATRMVNFRLDDTPQLVVSTYSKQLIFLDLNPTPEGGLDASIRFSQPTRTPVHQLLTRDVDGDGVVELVAIGYNDIQIIKCHESQLIQKLKQFYSSLN